MERDFAGYRSFFAVRAFWLVLAMVCLSLSMSAQQQAVLAWDPSPDPAVKGYNVYCGGSSQSYTNLINAQAGTNLTVTGLVAGGTYYFAATSYDASGLESVPSAEVVYTVPSPPFIGLIENQIIAVNGSTAPIPFLIGSAVMPAGALLLSASSSNPQLLTGSGIVFGGSDSNRTVQVTPLVGQSGVALITVAVTDTNGGSTTAFFQVSVQGPPVIFSQPSALVVGFGGTASLSVGADSPLPMSFQWLKNGAALSDGLNISGSTTATLTLSNNQGGASGAYSVRIGNAAGVVVSSVVTLGVNDPVLNSQPVALSRSAGGRAVFSAAVSGTGPLIYRWLRDGAALSDGGNVSGSASATLILDPVTGQDAAAYSVSVSNAFGRVVSVPAGLVVNDPAIVTQPAALVRNAGSSALFSVAVAGGAPAGYQWLKNGSPLTDGANVSGARSSTLNLNPLTGADAAVYSVRITNSFGTVTSSGAGLAVNDPVISGQPAGLTNFSGAGASFTVSAAGGGPMNYRWRKNGVPLSDSANVTGTGTAVLSLARLSAADSAAYTVAVGNIYGTAISDPAQLTVQTIAPVISPIRDQVVVENTPTAPLAFTVGEAGFAAGTLSLMAASSNPQLVSAAGVVFGGSDSNRTVQVTPVLNQSGTAWITVSVSDIYGNTCSNRFLLTVEGLPLILSQPVGLVLNAGGAGSLSVVATNAGSLTYRWFKDGVAMSDGAGVSGSSGATLMLTNVLGAAAGSYRVAVGNPVGSVLSSTATLQINDPVILSQSGALTRNAGGVAGFSVVVAGTGPLTYQWRKNGLPLSDGGGVSGSSSGTLNLNPLTGADAALYSVSVANAFGTATSSEVGLAVNDPVITSQPAGLICNAGSGASFTVAAAGGAPLTYQWRKNGIPLSDGGNVTGSTASRLVLSALTGQDAGNYSVTVTGTNGSVASLTAGLAVNDPVITSQPAGATNLFGTGTLLSVGVAGGLPINYQWLKNGVPLSDTGNVSGSGSATLGIDGLRAADSAGYSVVVSNSHGSCTSAPAQLLVVAPPANVLLVATNGDGAVTPVLNQQALVLGNTYGLTAMPAPGQIFAGWGGGITSSTPALRFTMTSNLMLVANFVPLRLGIKGLGYITPDLSGMRNLTAGAVYSLTAVPAPGQVFTGWTGTTNSRGVALRVCLTPGLELQANFVPVRVGVTGLGSVSPDLSRESNLTLGARYTLRAIPAAGQVFSGWTGWTNSTASSLPVVITSNLMLQADFIASPYPAVSGVYNGLFYEAEAVRLRSAGAVSVRANSRGGYSGKLQLSGGTYSFSGNLSPQNQAAQSFARGTNAPLTLRFALGSDQIHGSLSDGVWEAGLQGDRALFNAATNPAPQSGAYTMVLWRAGVPSVSQGHSYGTLTVSRGGLISFVGCLADGTKISQSAPLSQSGQWPFYVSLYAGKGLAASWINFTNQPSTDLSGALSWIRQGGTAARLYPGGFTNLMELYGSSYLPPRGTNRVLDMSVAQLLFSGGNLASDLSSLMGLGVNGRVACLAGARANMLFSAARGTFAGTVVEPFSGMARPFWGAVLQKSGGGYGFLLGPTETSEVSLLP